MSKWTTITVRISVEDREWLEVAAAKSGKPLSGYIVAVLGLWKKNQEKRRGMIDERQGNPSNI